MVILYHIAYCTMIALSLSGASTGDRETDRQTDRLELLFPEL
jgi:hypothetical protein